MGDRRPRQEFLIWKLRFYRACLVTRNKHETGIRLSKLSIWLAKFKGKVIVHATPNAGAGLQVAQE